jgi:hypothetical protein
MLDEGTFGTLEDLARAKGVHSTYVSRVLRLALLAPNIVEAILDGRQPVELQLDGLLGGFPLEWAGQLGCDGDFRSPLFAQSDFAGIFRSAALVKRHPALRDMATPTFTGMAGRHWRADRKSLRAPMAAVALRSGVGELQRVLEVAQAVAAALDV